MLAATSPKPSLMLRLPLPPNLGNRQMHHMERHRLKRGYWAICDLVAFGAVSHEGLVDAQQLTRFVTHTRKRDLARQVQTVLDAVQWLQEPRQAPIARPLEPWASVAIDARLTLGHPMDEENAKYRAYKWPCDWLRSRGFLADDTAARCTMAQPTQRVQRGGRYAVELTITPLA